MKTLLEEFIAWVGTQPPRRRYEFADSKQCALAQFARAHFHAQYVSGGVYTFTHGETAGKHKTEFLDVPMELAAAWGEALIDSKTFGQLSRALTPIMEKINAHV